MKSGRTLNSAEAAKRLGVTPKTLRLYEERGLVNPIRNDAGWRIYGPVQVGRLHQIIALKKLGLSLADISDLLAGNVDKLKTVLALQERALTKECQNISLALVLVKAAREKLAKGSLLSVDDLADLALETTPLTPLWEKYFSRAELDEIANPNDVDDEVIATWRSLFEEIETLAKDSDPHSVKALSLGRRWLEQTERYIGDDQALGDKLKAFALEAMSSPETRSSLPFTPEAYDFLVKVVEQVKSQR